MWNRHFGFPCASCGLALAITSVSGGLVRADGGQAAVQWHRDASDPRWVQGDATVNAPPEAVWARLAQVDGWTHVLTDVEKLKVLDRRTDDHGHVRWTIELETRTLDHGMLRYEVDSDPARSLLLTTDRMGVHVVGQTIVRAGPTPNQSNVVYSLFIRLSGLPSLLISEKSLRSRQEHMVAVTLGDIVGAFAKPAEAVPTH